MGFVFFNDSFDLKLQFISIEGNYYQISSILYICLHLFFPLLINFLITFFCFCCTSLEVLLIALLLVFALEMNNYTNKSKSNGNENLYLFPNNTQTFKCLKRNKCLPSWYFFVMQDFNAILFILIPQIEPFFLFLF